MSILHPRIIADLELRRFGLEVLPASDLSCSPGHDDGLIFSGDVRKIGSQFDRIVDLLTQSATGVVTAAGEEYRAPLAISNLNSKTRMTRLVEPTAPPEDYLPGLRGFRIFSTVLKINVACHRPPQYSVIRWPAPE